MPVRFHDEAASVRAIVVARGARPPLTACSRSGIGPPCWPRGVTAALGLPRPPARCRARGATSKLRARRVSSAAGLATPCVRHRARRGAGRGFAGDPRVSVSVRGQADRPVGQPRRDPRRHAGGIRRRRSNGCARCSPGPRSARCARRDGAQMNPVEGFIPGREFAIEGVLTHGASRPLAIFDKPDPLDGPFFEETIYVTPPRLAEQTRAGDHSGGGRRRRGAGPAARSGPRRVPRGSRERRDAGSRGAADRRVCARGCCVSRTRRRRRAARDLARGTAAAARARERMWRRGSREPQAAAVMMIPIPRAAFCGASTGGAAARGAVVEDVRITAKRDQLLEPLPEAGSYLGFIFARAAAGADRARQAVRDAHRAADVPSSTPIDRRAAASDQRAGYLACSGT